MLSSWVVIKIWLPRREDNIKINLKEISFRNVKVKPKGNIVPLLNWLSTTSWRRKGEWRYSATILDLGTRFRFKPWPLYPRRKSPRTYKTGGCVDPRAGLDSVEEEISCPYRESNPSRSASSPSLYWLSYPTEFNWNCFHVISPGLMAELVS
jgi:hypothetical protein